MNTFFKATWSQNLKLSTALFSGVMVLVMIIGGGIGALIGGLILLLCFLLLVRGYSLQENRLVVHGMLWSRSYPLECLVDIESSPFVTAGSIRMFGVGGLFSYLGYFRNPSLGDYLSYVTDPANIVVMKIDNQVILVSPEDPDAFIQAVRSIYLFRRI